MDNHTLQVLTVALGLGMLVGLQRERAESEVAGIRTFPLIFPAPSPDCWRCVTGAGCWRRACCP